MSSFYRLETLRVSPAQLFRFKPVKHQILMPRIAAALYRHHSIRHIVYFRTIGSLHGKANLFILKSSLNYAIGFPIAKYYSRSAKIKKIGDCLKGLTRDAFILVALKLKLGTGLGELFWNG